jgi:ubiquinone/menaquinone biosynthesis C-methylase UbiE
VRDRRLLLEYLGDGEVVGVDASPAMLHLVRAKAHRLGLAAPPLYEQRIEELSLPGELFYGLTHDAADPEDRLFWFTAVRPG